MCVEMGPWISVSFAGDGLQRLRDNPSAAHQSLAQDARDFREASMDFLAGMRRAG